MFSCLDLLCFWLFWLSLLFVLFLAQFNDSRLSPGCRHLTVMRVSISPTRGHPCGFEPYLKPVFFSIILLSFLKSYAVFLYGSLLHDIFHRCIANLLAIATIAFFCSPVLRNRRKNTVLACSSLRIQIQDDSIKLARNVALLVITTLPSFRFLPL